MTADKVPAPGKQLLIVDDDRLVLALMVSGLTEAGYGVTTAESAEDAEAWLAGGALPDLAILDVRMPGQGGLALAQRLRELDHIPFMMLSAYSARTWSSRPPNAAHWAMPSNRWMFCNWSPPLRPLWHAPMNCRICGLPDSSCRPPWTASATSASPWASP